jgi:uncharacterized protein YbjT (DUF2867 family)
VKPVLVTSGNIGDHVAEQLAAMECPYGLVRRGARDSRWVAQSVEQVKGDFNNPSLSFRRVQVWGSKFFSVSPMVENLAQLGINSIEAAKRAGVDQIVQSTVMGAAGDASIAIPRLHAQVEKALDEARIPYTLLRPNAFMQNYLGQAASIKTQNAFYLPQGEAAITMVGTRDIAAVAVRSLTEPGHLGKTYTVTGAEAVSNPEAAGKFPAVPGRTIGYVNVTDEEAADSMRAAGMTEWAIRATVEFMQVARAGYLAVVVEDAEIVLGRRPISFGQFLKDHLEAFESATLSQSGAA